MTDLFHKHLLTELRMVVYRPGDPAGMTDRLLCEAVTVNENLQSLGYILKPDDLARLAVSPDLHDFYGHVKNLVPEVTAQPMYPGFPQQVLEMDEAEFRFHQLLHYFSTYGLEYLFGVSVSRGWLPEYGAPVRDQADTRLMDARVVELVAEEEAAITALRILLGRRERMTNPELELVLEAASGCPVAQMKDLKVRFKENLDLLFPRLMGYEDREVALRALRAICAHTGDVFRCASDHLSRQKYHLATREKKLLVKLLEAYPVGDFRRNLMQSLRDREQNLTVLKHLDYNRFSRSPEHLEAVRALRNGELLSWHGVGEALLRDHSSAALHHLAQRPGYMVRMLNRLLSLDYDRDAILEALEPRAGAVSAHLLLKVIQTLTKRKDDLDEKYRRKAAELNAEFDRQIDELGYGVFRVAYEKALRYARQDMEYEKGRAEDAYRNNPIAAARELAKGTVRDLEIKILQKRTEYMKLRREQEQWVEHLYSGGNARGRVSLLQEKLNKLQREIDSLQAKFNRKEECALAWLENQIRVIEVESAHAISDAAIRAEENFEKKQRELKEAFERKCREIPQRQQQIEERRKQALEDLEEAKRQEGISQHYDGEAIGILHRLMKAHFCHVATPLKGKKVYLEMEQFDLVHSVLETENRSRDGGYIRSGIAWKIPGDAKYVRFFTYWNDPSRIDIDLHAGGRTLRGEVLHVGWNADFRNCGVVHSGDITHSDAAEYIDIDLSQPIAEIYANVHSFNGRPFRDIETCFVGMMAVDKIGADVKHYDPANCFFTHELKQNLWSLHYGFIDVQNRFVRFVGKENVWRWGERPDIENPVSMFSLQTYLDYVLEGQGVELVEKPEEADLVLTMGKSLLDNGLSLVDSNFFLEC